jgi:hypothetical protein
MEHHHVTLAHDTLALTAHAERICLLALLGLFAVGGLVSVVAARAFDREQRPTGSRWHIGAWIRDLDHTTTIVAGGPWATAVVVLDRAANPPVDRPVDQPAARAAQSPAKLGTGPVLPSAQKRRRPLPAAECVGPRRPYRTPSPESPVDPADAQETRTDRDQADGRTAHRQLHRRDPAGSRAHR